MPFQGVWTVEEDLGPQTAFWQLISTGTRTRHIQSNPSTYAELQDIASRLAGLPPAGLDVLSTLSSEVVRPRLHPLPSVQSLSSPSAE